MKFLTLLLTMAFSVSIYANDCTVEITNGFAGRPVNPENAQYVSQFLPILEKALTSKGFTVVRNSNIQPAHTLAVLKYATCANKGGECVGVYSQMTLISNYDYSCDGQCVFEGFSNKIPLSPRTSFIKAVNKIPYCR